ncbi:MAG: alpha/beta hydrolase [Lachnospiraceae bacterium]|nr:alpha/beta hydrolase [Lachnospiraceae bacterium]
MHNEKKLAVIFPGMGYHKDKPLLYYSARLAQSMGYEVNAITYHDLPLETGTLDEVAKEVILQAEEHLLKIDLKEYKKIVFIGKSIGTTALAKYAAEHDVETGQIWYTPVTATFSYPSETCIAFIGDADPCSDVAELKKMAAAKQIPLHTYPDCNHSLECGNTEQDLRTLQDVMQKTEQFLKNTF